MAAGSRHLSGTALQQTTAKSPLQGKHWHPPNNIWMDQNIAPCHIAKRPFDRSQVAFCGRSTNESSPDGFLGSGEVDMASSRLR